MKVLTESQNENRIIGNLFFTRDISYNENLEFLSDYLHSMIKDGFIQEFSTTSDDTKRRNNCVELTIIPFDNNVSRNDIRVLVENSGFIKKIKWMK